MKYLILTIIAISCIIIGQGFVKPTNEWIDITHQLECKDIGQVSLRTGKCLYGPNDALLEEYRELEMYAGSRQWTWNHGN